MSAAPNVAAVFRRDAREPAVLVVDGYGVSLTVARGHLVVSDGIGRHRRERRLTRAQRTVRRIVVLGHTGVLSLEAIRWCHDIGIALIHLATDGTLLASAGPSGRDDARLRRAQAAAAGTDIGLVITRQLLTLKLGAQATQLQTQLHAEPQSAALRDLAGQLADSPSLDRARELEAAAANIYFAAWAAKMHVPMIERDQTRVPEHWLTFGTRGSPLDYGRSPRKAATPINAVLNYGYALGEAETRFAILAVGLDPGLGLIHTDKKGRDSLALDLLEPLRPHIDHDLHALLARRKLAAGDFHETRDGQCRLLPPLTHEIAELLPAWTRIAGQIAESVAHRLASASGKPITLTTPLTGSKARAAAGERASTRRARRDPKAASPVPAACRVCGAALPPTGRKLCPTCWPETRAAIAADSARQRAGKLADLRRNGADPSNTPAARERRSSALAVRKQEQLAWDQAHGVERDNGATFEAIRATLQAVPLSQLQQATGLSLSACSRIRSGALTPHTRHWPALTSCGAASNDHDTPSHDPPAGATEC